MLVNVEFRPEEEIREEYYSRIKDKENYSKECIKWLKKVGYDGYCRFCGVHKDCQLETGVYDFDDVNLPTGLKNELTYEQEFEWCEFYNNNEDDQNYITPYGVADNLDQIKEYLRKAVEDPERHFFITVCKIWQKEQPERYGWRWCKWGPYIGKLDKQCEYLYDEDFGEDWPGYVYVFHCYCLD